MFDRLRGNSNIAVKGIEQCPYDVYSPLVGKNLSAVVFSPGAFGAKEDYRWIGRLLSEKGYVVFIYTPLGTRNDDLAARVECISVGIDYLMAQNEYGRFSGRIDESKIGVIGHSEGGGAAIVASLDDPRIKTLIGLAPYTGGQISGQNATVAGSEKINCSAISIPTLFVTGSKDVVIASSDVESCFNQINITYKSYISIPGSNHFSFCSGLVCLVKGGLVSGSLKSEVSDWLNKNLKEAEGF